MTGLHSGLPAPGLEIPYWVLRPPEANLGARLFCLFTVDTGAINIVKGGERSKVIVSSGQVSRALVLWLHSVLSIIVNTNFKNGDMYIIGIYLMQFQIHNIGP